MNKVLLIMCVAFCILGCESHPHDLPRNVTVEERIATSSCWPYKCGKGIWGCPLHCKCNGRIIFLQPREYCY
ncbi:hypothetical protein MTO96_017979 [Rhipicephalus appendiculatus]